MFGLGKKKQEPSSKLEIFLNKADDALTLAIARNDIQPAVQFMDSKLLRVLDEAIRAKESAQVDLGLEKYRLRTWAIQSDEPCLVKKSIRHNDVNIKGMVSIPVGDNIDEMWTVMTTAKGFIVTDIRRVLI